MSILLLITPAFVISYSAGAQANAIPVIYANPGAVYSQNFDGLPNSGSFSFTGKGPFNLSSVPINGSGLTGWQWMMLSGSNSNAVFTVGTGSSTSSGMYSFGSSGSTERALGSLASSSGVYAFGLLLTNSTGNILNSFSLGFTAEQWRKGGSTNKNIWSFRYKTGSFTNIDQQGLLADSSLNFSSIVTTTSGSSLNGNQPDNQQSLSYTINNISWKAGEQLLIRWDDADETGSDDACAIDNIVFSAKLLSTAPTLSHTAINNISTHSAELNGWVQDHFAATMLAFEYDTVNTWLHPQSVHGIPDSVMAGSGNTSVSATITGLLPGTVYYWRIKASNQNGTVVSPSQNFTTAMSLPTVLTSNVLSVTTHSALLGGTVTSSRGGAVTERGIVWSINPNPVLSNTKIVIGNGIGNFVQQENNLPVGKTIYARAYAINTAGTAYGNEISFSTLNTIVSLTTVSPTKTNAGSVSFSLQTAEVMNGASVSDFMIQSTGIRNAFITGMNISGNICNIYVNTGTGNGILGLSMVNNTGLSAAMENIPFTSTGFYTIDKTAPVVTFQTGL